MNIYVHRDASEVAWLVQQVGRSEDLIGASAVRALARIDPETAVAHLHKLPERHMALTRHWYFAELLARRPEAALSQLRRIMEDHPKPGDLGQVLQGYEIALDDRTLSLLMDDLERILDAESRRPDASQPGTGVGSLQPAGASESSATFGDLRASGGARAWTRN